MRFNDRKIRFSVAAFVFVAISVVVFQNCSAPSALKLPSEDGTDGTLGHRATPTPNPFPGSGGFATPTPSPVFATPTPKPGTTPLPATPTPKPATPTPMPSTSTPTPTPKPSTPVPATPTPLPPSNGLYYPFGSHRIAYVAGIKPTNATQAAMDAAVQNLYNAWKGTLRSNCGGLYVYKGGNAAAVSEGTGYGMLISVIMAGYDSGARTQFDNLYKFSRMHPAYNTDNALMDWAVSDSCSSAGGGYAAMDGDLDIAMALLMADKQWGSSGGAYNYKAEALKVIQALRTKSFNSAGYSMGGPSQDISRTSDYMITHFRAFQKATGDSFWDTAINKSFELMNLMQSKYSPSAGMIPDFIVGLPNNPSPSPGNRIESTTEGYYAWNACRIPWRMASDYVTSGDTRSKTVGQKIVSYIRGASGGNPGSIAAGYKLDGSALASYPSMSFIGPVVAGAIVDSSNQAFLNSLWTYSSTKLAGGYYDNELQLLGLIVASGNWWNP